MKLCGLSLYVDRTIKDYHLIVVIREYWIIYRWPGLLAVQWFGSYPTPSPTSPASKGGGGEVRGGAKSYNRERAWSSINLSKLSEFLCWLSFTGFTSLLLPPFLNHLSQFRVFYISRSPYTSHFWLPPFLRFTGIQLFCSEMVKFWRFEACFTLRCFSPQETNDIIYWNNNYFICNLLYVLQEVYDLKCKEFQETRTECLLRLLTSFFKRRQQVHPTVMLLDSIVYRRSCNYQYRQN